MRAVNDICVKIKCHDSGTGFILSLNKEHDCILTAAHCLEKCTSKSDIIIIPDAEVIDYWISEEPKIHDVAIIFIKKVERPLPKVSITRVNDDTKISNDVCIFGFPGAKEENTINYKKLKFEVITIENGHVILQLQNNIESLYNESKTLLDGMSGGPAYIQEENCIKIIGLLTSTEHADFSYKEINVITIQQMLEYYKTSTGKEIDLVYDNIVNKGVDPSYAIWPEITDQKEELLARDLRQKIKDVCTDYSELLIKKMYRKITQAEIELDRYPIENRAAYLYQIFDAANDAQIKLVELEKDILDKDEVNAWIEEYANKAYIRICDKSKDYDYILKNNDLVKNTVLKLIAECYLSFDVEGLII